MRVNPDKIIVEGAEGFARISRQHAYAKCLSVNGLPGSWDRIETSRKHAEQERPNWNRTVSGGTLQGTTEAAYCQCQLGVGSAHSSDEAWKAALSGRHSGAKGLTGQGTRGRER
jgi:hypothetical protein